MQAIGGHKPCWVKASQMDVNGDIDSLEIDYPDLASLPQSPYYSPTVVTKVVREGTQVKVIWLDIPLHPGDEESPIMQHYIGEVWHCQAGQIVFDPLATTIHPSHLQMNRVALSHRTEESSYRRNMALPDQLKFRGPHT